MPRRSFLVVTVLTSCFAIVWSAQAIAQVGKGLVDLNSAPEKELTALPSMTPVIVKGLLDKRPFATAVDANAYLTSQSLSPAQLAEVYRKALSLIHI